MPIGSTRPQLQQKITLEKATQRGKYCSVSCMTVIYILDSYLIAKTSCSEVSVHLYDSILMYIVIWGSLHE